ncbi:hypothetical protein I600_422 [Maribacter dokdonensis DSW-8]|nr:hypothetical protein I600_422 [Maribacter dokdonensis DSW-8]
MELKLKTKEKIVFINSVVGYKCMSLPLGYLLTCSGNYIFLIL